MNYRRNPAGVARLLKSFEGTVNAHAQKVADGVRSQEPEADVVVEPYETDRDAAMVLIREPQALYWQARDGILTRAASSAGLEVRSRA